VLPEDLAPVTNLGLALEKFFFDKSLGAVIVMQALTLRYLTIQARDLPMIDEKKTTDIIETSLIYLLSA